MNKHFLNMIFAAGMGALIMLGSASCSADNKSQTQKKEDETVRRERVAVERGNSHFAHGDYADALDQYNSAIEANPQSKVARFNRAMALSQLISDEERDQLLQPDSLRVPNTMREQAIKAYSDFTGTPSDTTYYTNSNYNLGNLYYSDGKYFYDKDSIQNAMSGGMAAMAGGSMQDYRKHAVETLEESVAAYKRTLNLEPERMEARENLRLAQILLDKLKDDNGGGQNNDQQQQQQDQQQQQQQNQQQDQQQDQQQQSRQPQQQQQQNEDIERQLRAVQMKEDQTRRDKDKDAEPVYGRPQRKPW